ncbi:MAG: hypothetical protein GY844_07340 [Bradyrhizobium sp.]|nr:hypothetical protein [Bradyrhizobium sp.]
MDVTECWTGKRCVLAALILSALHILTTLGTGYQAHWFRLEFDHAFVVNFAVFLAPVAVLLLFSRWNCTLVALFGIPVVIFFVLRMHRVWQFHWFQTNSMSAQKGDGLSWYQVIFESIAVLAFGFGVVLSLVSLASKFFDRRDI